MDRKDAFKKIKRIQLANIPATGKETQTD